MKNSSTKKWVSARTAFLLASVSTAVLTAMSAAQEKSPKSEDKSGKSAQPAAAVAKPAMTVTTTNASNSQWPIRLAANGNIAAWEETIVGAEASGLRITQVRAAVGDFVRKGQLLATLSADAIQSDFNTQSAGIAEAEVALAQARADAARARTLQDTGAMPAAQIAQYQNTERAAEARLNSLRIGQKSTQVRLSQTQVVAPDSGIVSMRAATVGGVVAPGQELFRLIRNGRLEWRAEVTATELSNIRPGQAVSITLPSQTTLNGKVRMVGPTVDPVTRNALVYVDLTANPSAKAGMYASGEFDVGSTAALTVPQSALVLRDGFSYVMKVGAGDKVTQRKVTVGRRVAGRAEILSGLVANESVVSTGAAFLTEGDTVRVVAQPQASAPTELAPLVDASKNTVKPSTVPSAQIVSPAKPSPTATIAGK